MDKKIHGISGYRKNYIEELLPLPQTREEFYEWLRADVKAEFIKGKVIVHPPALRPHNSVNHSLSCVIQSYFNRFEAAEGEVALEKALCVFPENDFEPDFCFWEKEKIDAMPIDGYKYPVPDFIAEILSKSTARRDRGIKKNEYEKNGVKEYWIIDPKLQTVECYVRNAEGKFELLPAKDILRPTLFPGLAFPKKALFSPVVLRHFCRTFVFPAMDAKVKQARAETLQAFQYETEAREEAARAREETAKAREEEAKAQEEIAKAQAEMAKAQEEIAKAIEEAAAKAKKEIKRQMIRTLHKEGFDVEKIALLTELSVAEVLNEINQNP